MMMKNIVAKFKDRSSLSKQTQILSANPRHISNQVRKIRNPGNWFDGFIGFFSPSTAVRRIHARSILRGYEGAARGRRLKNWTPQNTSAAVEVAKGGSMLRARSRDLSRNSAYGTKALEVIVNNTVGTGIMLKAPTEALQKRWEEWYETKTMDFEGNICGYEMQTLGLRSIVEGGELLIRKYRNTGKDKDKAPYKLQLLEPDMIDSSHFNETGSTQDGIELDDKGRVVGYHLFENHPGNILLGNQHRNSYKSNLINKEHILHVFKRLRIGQIRGVPWVAAVLVAMRDYDDYEDAQLMRQKIAACFVGFLKTSEDPITQTDANEEKKPMSERFEPGIIEELPPGYDMNFSTPPGVGGDYEPFVRRKLGAIAAGYGISYEAMTGDLTKTNYSSGRMGWIEMSRNINAWQWQMLIPQMLQPTWELFLEGEEIRTGKQDLLEKYRNEAVFTPPRREMIDPTKEVPATRDAVRSGLISLSEALRQQGSDPKTVLNELSEDLKFLDGLGLTLDSDPRNGINSSTTSTDEVKEEPKEKVTDNSEEDNGEEGQDE